MRSVSHIVSKMPDTTQPISENGTWMAQTVGRQFRWDRVAKKVSAVLSAIKRDVLATPSLYTDALGGTLGGASSAAFLGAAAAAPGVIP